MGEKKLVPEIRFPAYEDVWIRKRLDEIAKIERGRFSPRPRNNPIYYNGNVPFVQTGDVVHSNGKIINYSQTLNKEGLKVSKLFPKGTILITIAANIGYSGVLQMDMACPDSLIGLTCKSSSNNYFLNYLLLKEQPKIDYLAVSAAQKNINIEFLKPYKFILPSLPEQQKIATFLTSIDERIQLLEKKKESLEDYKKGIMQKIFSQEIRFKDEDGNDYPEWEDKKLDKVFSGLKGKGLSKDKLEVKGANKCILYGELYTVYPEVIKKIISFTNTNEGVLSKENDLLVPCSTTTSGIDLANVTALKENNILIGGDITILRPKKVVVSEFFAYYLSNFKKIELARFGQGTTIVHLYYNHFKVLKIDIPHVNEQQKIASFLSSIEDSIEQVVQQIEHSKTYKKGLLQKMFV